MGGGLYTEEKRSSRAPVDYGLLSRVATGAAVWHAKQVHQHLERPNQFVGGFQARENEPKGVPLFSRRVNLGRDGVWEARRYDAKSRKFGAVVGLEAEAPLLAWAGKGSGKQLWGAKPTQSCFFSHSCVTLISGTNSPVATRFGTSMATPLLEMPARLCRVRVPRKRSPTMPCRLLLGASLPAETVGKCRQHL